MENKGFLQILKEKFTGKSEQDILIGDSNNVVIPIEWMFTENIDRDIIESAMAQLLQKSNEGYKQKMEYLEKSPSKIKNIILHPNDEKMHFTIEGQDGWTKAIVTENQFQVDEYKNQGPIKNGILRANEEDLYEEILQALKCYDLNKISNELKLNYQDREKLSSIFPTHDGLTVEGIKKAMAEAANNLGEYYDYLCEEKKKSSVYSTVIQQRKDKKIQGKNTYNNGRAERKSDIYPFADRATIYEGMNPITTIKVDSKDENQEICKNAYIVYVYPDIREENNYIFVSEPLEGTHYTRIVSISKQEVESVQTDEQPKHIAVAKKYLEMSSDEFSLENNTVALKHGISENYEKRIRYIITGEESKETDNHKLYYKTIINKLHGKATITIPDIEKIVEEVPMSKIDMKMEETEQGEKNNE